MVGDRSYAAPASAHVLAKPCKSRAASGLLRPDLQDQARAVAKQYHDAIRQQKKSHWQELLTDNDNIWDIAKYMCADGSAAFNMIPPLGKRDGGRTTNCTEQAEELLKTFFPPLPAIISDEGLWPHRPPVSFPSITMEEVERQLFAAKSWKAPGDDGLPTVVWKQTWPAVKNRVLTLFSVP